MEFKVLPAQAIRVEQKTKALRQFGEIIEKPVSATTADTEAEDSVCSQVWTLTLLIRGERRRLRDRSYTSLYGNQELRRVCAHGFTIDCRSQVGNNEGRKCDGKLARSLFCA